MNWNQFDTFFFDLDDTLINTRASIRAGWRAALQHPELPKEVQESGFKIVEHLCWHFSSNAYHEYWKAFVTEMLPNVSDSVSLATELCVRYENAYWKNLQAFHGVPEILRLLQTLKKPIALITNGILEFQHEKLRKTDIYSTFEKQIFCSESVSFDHKKPAPIMLHMAFEHLQCNPETTVFLGNAPIDIISGNLAKVTTVAVTEIPNPCQLKINTPDAFLSSWEDLKTALNSSCLP